MAIRASDDGELQEHHEINVTPFIDVMLVLLIIFMLAAPLASVDVPVELPASTAQPQPSSQDPIYVTVRADLGLNLGDTPIEKAGLKAGLDRASHEDHAQRIFLRADRSVPYGELMSTMDALRDAGYLKVALVGQGQDP